MSRQDSPPKVTAADEMCRDIAKVAHGGTGIPIGLRHVHYVPVCDPPMMSVDLRYLEAVTDCDAPF